MLIPSLLLSATLIAVYGLFMPAMGWGWTAVVWGYELAWFMLNDQVKFVVYRMLDPQRAILATTRDKSDTLLARR